MESGILLRTRNRITSEEIVEVPVGETILPGDLVEYFEPRPGELRIRHHRSSGVPAGEAYYARVFALENQLVNSVDDSGNQAKLVDLPYENGDRILIYHALPGDIIKTSVEATATDIVRPGDVLETKGEIFRVKPTPQGSDPITRSGVAIALERSSSTSRIKVQIV